MEQSQPGTYGVLVICNGGFEGMEYELRSEETLIGRNPTTDITLLDENISREHSIILLDCEVGSYTIEDLQSTNGTKVNGKKVRSSELSDDDEIEIGHTRFRFLIRRHEEPAVSG
ncbi:MAG: FHA domain-containing protein [Myxococcota bacterium]|jgi:pSer/pThr/pTyr-binding forkhead associated (FHA) protein